MHGDLTLIDLLGWAPSPVEIARFVPKSPGDISGWNLVIVLFKLLLYYMGFIVCI